MLHGASHRLRLSDFLTSSRHSTRIGPREKAPGPPELAPGLRRLMSDGCDLWGIQIGSRPSLCSKSRLPSIHPDGQGPGSVQLSGPFSFQFPYTNLCAGIVFVEAVKDMLLFHLPVVLVNKSLHAIQYHGLIQVRSP